MKPARSLCHLTTVLLSLSPLVAAWPTWLPELDSLIVRRQDDGDSSSSSDTVQATATATATGTASSPSETGSAATTTSKKNQAETTNLNTGGRTVTDSATDTASGSGSKKTSATATHTDYDARDPAGSVVMVTPATTEGTQLYKIGDYVTWGWNYTNLQGAPTAIDVLVSCSAATETWTLTQNMTFATLGSYTWDTGAYQQTAVASPLLTEEYTLVIYDADSSVSATAEAGYLGPYTGFTFGMYEGQSYTPLSEWTCATCSAAMGDTEKRVIGFAVSMAAVTVLSFTWFVAGLW